MYLLHPYLHTANLFSAVVEHVCTVCAIATPVGSEA